MQFGHMKITRDTAKMKLLSEEWHLNMLWMGMDYIWINLFEARNANT